MNQDHLSLVNNFLSTHQDVIAPGSIEETSLHTAAMMMGQGQNDVAGQIINSLLIDEKIKQECLRALSGKTSAAESTKVAPVVETPTPEVFTPKAQDPVISSWTPTPTPTPTPPPPMVPEPITQPVPTPSNFSTEITASTDPVFFPEVVTSPTTEISEQPNTKEEEKPFIPEAPTPPVPPSFSPSETMTTEPALSKNTPQDISPIETTEASPSSLNNGDIWNRFNAILAEEKTNPKVTNDISHLERVEQLGGALEKAGNTVEEKQDETIGEDYDHVFGGGSHSKRFEVPAIIKTYETAQSTIDKEETQQAEHLSERLDTYKKYFDAAEQYLTRAYGSGNINIMASAHGQFESLQQRYPKYVQHRAAHIADMQKIIDSYAQKRAETIAHDSFNLDENTTIAPGMRITGENETYVIASISQATTDHEALVIFTADHTKNIYEIPAPALASALTNSALNTDEFFEGFIKEKEQREASDQEKPSTE